MNPPVIASYHAAQQLYARFGVALDVKHFWALVRCLATDAGRASLQVVVQPTAKCQGGVAESIRCDLAPLLDSSRPVVVYLVRNTRNGELITAYLPTSPAAKTKQAGMAQAARNRGRGRKSPRRHPEFRINRGKKRLEGEDDGEDTA